MEDIYTYLESVYKIDNIQYKFKRDYIQNPLQKNIKKPTGGYKYEDPFVEDLLFLYSKCFLNLEFISEILGITKFTLINWFKAFNISRNDKEINKKIREKTNLIKYGYKQYSSSNECKEKVKKTNLEKYGTEFPQQSEIIKQKQKETDEKNHNGISHQKTKEFIEKSKQTKLEKYGDENYTNREKAKQTCLEKYGVENPSCNNEIKKKISSKNRELSNKAKSKRVLTNLEKYGVEFFCQKHYDKKSFEIINNKELLKDYIEKNKISNILELSDKLNISNSVLGRIIFKYDLYASFDYCGSLIEKEIREYINQYYETENNTRKYLDGKEIDIFIPKLNIGIEFNGNFWHNEYGKEKNYHQNKSLLAESKGIFIYHIFEYEWIEKKDKIINQLNNLLGINQEKIYARKCIIKEVDTKSKKLFLEKNHLQGNDSSSVKLGLYYEDELFSLMTFVKPRFNKKYEWELSRFCSKNNCNVIGGASKLFKYFVDNYNPTSIISYSNISHTKGKLYETLGFKLVLISEPNYVWCKGYDVLSRYQCQKHKLLEQGYEGNTESEIMHNLGYYKIYDCGNKVWVWKR